MLFLAIIVMALAILLDEILPMWRSSLYFRYLVVVYKKRKPIFNSLMRLPAVEKLHNLLFARIKNKYKLYESSQKQLFFKEFEWNYSVSRYSICPIHGSIDLVSPNEIEVSLCINLKIPAILFLFYFISIFRFHSLLPALIITAVTVAWFFLLIRNRFSSVSGAIDEWLSNG